MKLLCLSLLLFSSGAASLCATETGKPAAPLQVRLESAKAGDVITLPEGEHVITGWKIPAGVTLTGADARRTILKVEGAGVGLSLEAVRDVTIRRLTVRSAGVANLMIAGAGNITLDSVIVQGSETGVLVKDSRNVVLRNVVAAGNRVGVGLLNVSGVAMVNCSLVESGLAALSSAGETTGVVFNTVFSQGPLSILADTKSGGLKLDHNLYWTANLGRMEGHLTRRSLAGWRAITPGDAHSLQTEVRFRDPAALDFAPVNAFDWRPYEPVTAGWGVATFEGVEAPATDLAGAPREGGFGLGALNGEIPGNPARRPADGELAVENRGGVKSAGLFTPEGVRVALLFQNLPLAPGRHPFWIPSRDWQGQPIPEGTYEVRLAESDLSNTYVGTVGNFAKSARIIDSFSWPEEFIAFDAKDRVIVAQNSFENGTGIRGFDPAYAECRWMVPGGGGTVGVAVEGDLFYYIQKVPGNEPAYTLRRMKVETGEYLPFDDGHYQVRFRQPGGSLYGMAIAGGRIYLSDPEANRLWVTRVADPSAQESLAVPAPSCVSFDEKSGCLWVISGGKELLALDPATGAVRGKMSLPVGIERMHVRNGRLAYLSRQSGKIGVLDVTRPESPAPLREIGTGDGPYGRIQADRFWFQKAKGQTPGQPEPKINVAINSRGDVAVIDQCRVLFWGADGKLIREGLGMWGQHLTRGKVAGDDRLHLWSVNGDYDIALDAKSGQWEPGTLWSFPPLPYPGRSPIGFFTHGGRNFALRSAMLKINPAKPTEETLAIAVIGFEGAHGKLLTLYFNQPGGGPVMLTDANGNGVPDDTDPVEPLVDREGKPLPPIPFGRYRCEATMAGDLLFAVRRGPTSAGLEVPFTGLDAKGAPRYDWQAARSLEIALPGEKGTVISPYDFETEESLTAGVIQVAPLSDGGFASSLIFRSSAGTGLQNGAGTEMAGFGPAGRLRWVNPLSWMIGAQGVQSIPEKKLLFTMWPESCDYLVFDEDGLGLGSLGMHRESHWAGMWSDHAQQQWPFLGNDGKPYYVLGDYALNAFHWFGIRGVDEVRRSRFPVKLSGKTAETLAALPLPRPALRKWPEPAGTRIVIRKLPEPLPVGGDPEVWGKALAPVALVTPEMASGDIRGAQDCCATLRLAYLGDDLYVQTIVFDDRVLFHQNAELMYRQDGLEVAINGFMEGFKFNVGKTVDRGETLLRNRFAVGKLDRYLEPELAPRSVRVIEDVSRIADRKLLEDATGKDLSRCHAIVTQFRLPLARVWEGSPAPAPAIRSGESMRIGIYINDSDLLGGDVQDFIPWPVGYNLFATREAGALATFE